MSEPLVLQQVGSRWEVYLDVDAARRRVGRYKSSPNRFLNRYPAGALVPVAKKGGSLSLTPEGEPHRFASKGDAERAAHHIGRYALDLGDFLHTYSEVRRVAGGTRKRHVTEKAFRNKASRWLSRRDVESVGHHGYKPRRPETQAERLRRIAEHRRRYARLTQSPGEQGPGYDQRRRSRRRRRR